MLNIIGTRKIWFTFSGLLVLGSVLSLVFWEPNLGIDFTGGTALEYRFPGQRPAGLAVSELLEQVAGGKFAFTAVAGPERTAEDAAKPAAAGAKTTATTADTGPDAATNPDATTNPDAATNPDATADQQPFTPPEPFSFGKPIIQPIGERNLLLKVRALENNQQQAITLAIQQQFGQDVTEIRSETIGPLVGRNLRKKALFALLLASFLIIIYIAFAFRKIPRSLSPVRFGVTAVIALIHDVLATVGFFMVLGYFWGVEIDSLFATALLTIMGFSVHDTIVVFDRIRENLIRARQQDFAQIANDSVNQTMARSINTSLTTLITLSALFFFGGGSIKWFVLAMMFGIVIGTYSSIFLATPLLVVWRQALLRRGKGD